MILEVQIRWLIRRDMEEVLRIESECFNDPWNSDDFMNCLRERNCIGMVVENDQKILGFMIYELHQGRLQILNFAVDPLARFRGVGSQMVGRLISKLSYLGRREITLNCRERNLDAQLFFQRLGFRTIGVLRDYYDSEHDYEDAYVMQYLSPAKEGVIA